MKRKTRRNIRRFFGTPLALISGVFTVGGFIAAYYLKPLVEGTILENWFWLIVLVILGLINWGLYYIYLKASAPEINYFEEKNFRKPDENTILSAIDGILNTEKVEPFYVHAAPRSKEMETVYLRLKEIGFAMISGGPGEGKSMLAFLTAYKLREEDRYPAYMFQYEDRYHVYTLNVELLEDKRGKDITDEVLSQLDNLKGKRKLILVDDAHKLAIKQDLNIILQQEAK